RRCATSRIPSDSDTSPLPSRLPRGTPNSRRVPIRRCHRRLTPPCLRISQSLSFLFLDQLLDREVSAWVGPASRGSSSYSSRRRVASLMFPSLRRRTAVCLSTLSRSRERREKCFCCLGLTPVSVSSFPVTAARRCR